MILEELIAAKDDRAKIRDNINQAIDGVKSKVGRLKDDVNEIKMVVTEVEIMKEQIKMMEDRVGKLENSGAAAIEEFKNHLKEIEEDEKACKALSKESQRKLKKKKRM